MEQFIFGNFPVRKIIGWVFIISGLICVIPLLVFGLPKWNFFMSSVYADGRMVEFSRFSFSDGQGIEYKVYCNESWASGYGLESRFQVLYPPQNPKDAVIYNFFQYWIIPLTTVYLVFSNLIIGLIVLFWPRIKKMFVKPKNDAIPTV